MNGPRILVVEDDTDIREGMIDLLEHHGFDAVGASNGERALNLLRAAEQLPCLILLDLMMPVMDGIAFREVQMGDSRLAQIPVVIVTANREAQANVDRLQAARVIRKPPRVEELVATVKEFCQGLLLRPNPQA